MSTWPTKSNRYSSLVWFIAGVSHMVEQFYNQIRKRSPVDHFTLYASRTGAQSVQLTSQQFRVILPVTSYLSALQ
jgi:hypothetical protein